ncbi:precorrin-3B synthase [Methylobacterium sp. P5_C11]
MSAGPFGYRRVLPEAPARRGWCPGLARPMPTGDGLLARVHPPLGILTLAQARAVAEGAVRFGNGHLDLTARANLQVRGVTDATRTALAGLLEEAGLGDVRSDAGPQRVTLTSPNAGLDTEAVIDVPALADAIETAARGIPGLPPKTLVVVAGQPGVALPEADLLMSARDRGTVTIAATFASGVRDLVTGPESEAADRMARLLAAFASTGRRRMRDLSEDEQRSVTGALPGQPPRLPASPPARTAIAARGNDAPFAPVAGLHAGAGLDVLVVDAPFGRCTAAALTRIADAAEALGSDTLRLSPNRGFVLIASSVGLAAATLADLADVFIVAPTDPRRAIDACTGAPGCASGSTPTLSDAARLAEAFGTLAEQGRSAHVSGCAKGCARPGPADLTLVGRNGLYGVVIGGGPGDEPAMDLPIEAVLERLGRANTVGLAAAFAPETARTACGRTRRPA